MGTGLEHKNPSILNYFPDAHIVQDDPFAHVEQDESHKLHESPDK